MQNNTENKVCYWCKNNPCTCPSLSKDYPKSMIKPAFQPKVCTFCKQVNCTCSPTPFAPKRNLSISEQEELEAQIENNK